jgi:hypothetical protein
MKSGIELIAEERQRQIEKEGWSKEHDAEHYRGEMAIAAMCYADPRKLNGKVPYGWPWDDKWWKPKDRVRNLVKAGALIAAEIDRLNNQTPTP